MLLKPQKSLKTPVRCLIWGTGNEFLKELYLINYYEMVGAIEVYAITAAEHIYTHVGNYKFIEYKSLKMSNFDVVIVTTGNKKFTNEITETLHAMGVDDSRIIPIKVFSVLGFDINKYVRIKESVPSIFAPNCWGGITYNRLGLRFNSPLINMWEEHDDYLKLIADPHRYFSYDLKFVGMGHDMNSKKDYPIARCGDILLHFNHYCTFEEANSAWIRRKKRIDWNNVLVMFFHNDPNKIEEFIHLEYKHKICFAPFDYNNDCVLSLKQQSNKALSKKEFWEIVNGLGRGMYLYYDVFDLLLDGKITKYDIEFFIDDL